MRDDFFTHLDSQIHTFSKINLNNKKLNSYFYKILVVLIERYNKYGNNSTNVNDFANT